MSLKAARRQSWVALTAVIGVVGRGASDAALRIVYVAVADHDLDRGRP